MNFGALSSLRRISDLSLLASRRDVLARGTITLRLPTPFLDHWTVCVDGGPAANYLPSNRSVVCQTNLLSQVAAHGLSTRTRFSASE